MAEGNQEVEKRWTVESRMNATWLIDWSWMLNTEHLTWAMFERAQCEITYWKRSKECIWRGRLGWDWKGEYQRSSRITRFFRATNHLFSTEGFYSVCRRNFRDGFVSGLMIKCKRMIWRRHLDWIDAMGEKRWRGMTISCGLSLSLLVGVELISWFPILHPSLVVKRKYVAEKGEIRRDELWTKFESSLVDFYER